MRRRFREIGGYPENGMRNKGPEPAAPGSRPTFNISWMGDGPMTPQRSLVLASIAFAVLWTLGMIWWTGTQIGNVISLTIAGAVAGVLWYFAMRWWQTRVMSRS